MHRATDPALTHNEEAHDSFHRGDITRAIEQFRLAAIAGEDPECAALERWLALMTAGQFADAWRESDRVLARRKQNGETCGHLPPHRRFVWNGEPLNARPLLVRCYHGLGDIIQFIRYVPRLQALCGSVHVQAPAELAELLQSVDAIDSVIPLDHPDPSFDLAIELMEVPYALRTSLANIPHAVPYLSAKPNPKILACLAGEHRLRVGLVWASGAWRPERSIPLSCFSFFQTLPGVAVVGLQRGPATDNLPPSAPPFICTDWTNTNVTDTAALIQNLDLVISTDTMVAHLAGALAKPVWTLLPFHADWRWMTDRDDSPWYPTMRLFRQPSPGDWDSVVGRVKQELEGLTDYQREGLRP